MINVWISAGYSYPKLQHSIYKCQTLPRDTYLPDFIAILEMHSSKFPPNWKGFGLNFLVDKTITFFKVKASVYSNWIFLFTPL